MSNSFSSSFAFQVDMVKAANSLHNLVFSTDEKSFEWMAREPLEVVSTFTLKSTKDCFTKVDISERDWDVLAPNDP